MITCIVGCTKFTLSMHDDMVSLNSRQRFGSSSAFFKRFGSVSIVRNRGRFLIFLSNLFIFKLYSHILVKSLKFQTNEILKI